MRRVCVALSLLAAAIAIGILIYRLDHAPPKGPTVVHDMGTTEIMKK